MEMIIISIQTKDGRVIGAPHELKYSIERQLSPMYTMGNKPFKPSVSRIAGSFNLKMPLDGEWLTGRSGVDTFEPIEPVEITVRYVDAEGKITISNCELLKVGSSIGIDRSYVSYRDLIGYSGIVLFIADSIHYEGMSFRADPNIKSDKMEDYRVPHIRKVTQDDMLANVTDLFKIPTSDEIVCAQQLTKPSEDPHKGMIYNPYTDKWSFL